MVPMDKSFAYIGFPDVDFTSDNSTCSGGWKVLLPWNTAMCATEGILAGLLFIGTIVFNFFAFVTKAVVVIINAVFVFFSFLNLLIGWMTFNIPGAPGWARVFFSVVVTGPLVVSAFQHLRGN